MDFVQRLIERCRHRLMHRLGCSPSTNIGA
jgi:hypothetical protein